MKNGKFETQKEIFEALLRGEKIIDIGWSKCFVFFTKEGFLFESDRSEFIRDFLVPSNWSIYQEPKPKKTIEVKYYRYHCKRVSLHLPDSYYLSGWTSKIWEKYKSEDSVYSSLLKTEERIEIYEVDNE